MKILVTGGGTGGHVTPILAVLQHLQDKVPELETLYVIDEHDDDAMLKRKGIQTSEIKSGKFRRFSGRSFWWHIRNLSLVIANVRDVFRVMYGFIQSLRIIKEFKPEIIFIKGGYVGVPIGLAASLLHVPYIIHDSDVVPGLANKILSPRAEKVAVGFPVQYYNYPSKKVEYTGNPVRKEFVQTYNNDAIKNEFDINNDNPVILVVGGSSGSQKINQAIESVADELLEIGNILHITGVGHTTEDFNTTSPNSNKYITFEFIHDFHKALYIADVVISRAGASSIAEAAAMRKATILIPHPHLTGEHQLKNAQVVEEMRSAFVIHQKEVLENPLILTEAVLKMLEDEDLRNNIYKLYKNDAAEHIASILVEEARSGEEKAQK